MSAKQLGYSNFVRNKCNVDLSKIKRNIIPVLLYDRLSSKYLSKEVSWDQSSIIIADTVRIQQPYLAQNIVPLGKIADSRRVESIVTNFHNEFSSITLYKEQLSPNLKQQLLGTAMPTTRYMLYTLQNIILLDYELVNRTLKKDNVKITPNDNDESSSVALRTLPSTSSLVRRAKPFRVDLIKQVSSPNSPKPNANYKEVVKKIDNSTPMSYQPRAQKLTAEAPKASSALPVQSVRAREQALKLVPRKAKTDIKPINTTSRATNAREPTPKLIPRKAKTEIKPISTTGRATYAREPTPKLVSPKAKTDIKPIAIKSRATNAREPTPKLVPRKAKTEIKPITIVNKATNARQTNLAVTKQQKAPTAWTTETKREPALKQTRRYPAATNNTAVLNRKLQSKAIDSKTKPLSVPTNNPPKLIRSLTFTIEESAQPTAYPERPVEDKPIIENPLVEVNVNLREQIYKQKPTEQLSVLSNQSLLKLPIAQKTLIEDFVILEEWLIDEKPVANQAHKQLTAEEELKNQQCFLFSPEN